jgi:hypothetical protein
MAANEIVLKLKAENEQLKASLDEATKKIDAFSKKTSTADKVLNAALKMTAPIAAFKLFNGAIKESIKQFTAQEDAEAKLNAVLKSTGGAAGFTAKELTDMASQLQEVTTFGDETTISAQTLMLTFTNIGKKVFPDAIEAAMDMSTVLGQDLQQSTMQLGIALNNPIEGMTRLRRVGVAFTGEQVNMVTQLQRSGDIMGAQKIILKELNTEFGGAARAAGQTLGGQLKMLQNRIGEVFEGIGKDLAPALKILINQFMRSSATGDVFSGIIKKITNYVSAGVFALSLFVAQMEMTNIEAKKLKLHEELKAAMDKNLPDETARLLGEIKKVNIELDNQDANIKNITKQAEIMEATIEKTTRTWYGTGKRVKEVSDLVVDGVVKIRNFKKVTDEVFTGKQKVYKDDPANAAKRRKDIMSEYLEYTDQQVAAELAKEKFKYDEMKLLHKGNKDELAAIDAAYEKRKLLAEVKGTKEQYKHDADFLEAKLGFQSQEYAALQKMTAASTTLMSSKNKTIFGLGKGLAYAQAGMNAAQAITRTMAEYPWPYNLVLAGITGLAAGIEMKKISDTKLPSHEAGRVPTRFQGYPNNHYPAMVGTDEAVINGRATRNNAALLSYMNENPNKTVQSGGQTVVNNYDFSGGVMLDQFVEQKIVTKLEQKAREQGTTLFNRQKI